MFYSHDADWTNQDEAVKLCRSSPEVIHYFLFSSSLHTDLMLSRLWFKTDSRKAVSMDIFYSVPTSVDKSTSSDIYFHLHTADCQNVSSSTTVLNTKHVRGTTLDYVRLLQDKRF